jgi:hypothetical protein
MKDHKQIRNSAWRLLWDRRWIVRIAGAAILLSFATKTLLSLVSGAVGRFCSCSAPKLARLPLEALKALEWTPRSVWELVSSSLLLYFFSLVASGISTYGMTATYLRAADDDADGWLKAAFGGFAAPLELAWMMFRLGLVFLGWSLLALGACGAVLLIASHLLASGSLNDLIVVLVLLSIAGPLIFCSILSVPFYRYRYLFRIKADHPDRSIQECFAACRTLTDGKKWLLFKHDCTYWRSFLLPAAALCIWMGLEATGNATEPRHSLLTAVFTAGLATAVFHNAVGQSILYGKTVRSAG